MRIGYKYKIEDTKYVSNLIYEMLPEWVRRNPNEKDIYISVIESYLSECIRNRVEATAEGLKIAISEYWGAV